MGNKDDLRAVFSDASRAGWSLRSDIQLQEWLEGFAERLKERVMEVTGEVHRLETQTCNVELHLKNTFNSLRAMSATQFIENRVDEADEIFDNKLEPQLKQSRVENYDSQIMPRYKEAVLTAWDAFQGFSTSKQSLRRTSQGLQIRPSMNLPHVIGTEEFIRDSDCGLTDFKFPEVDTRASSSEPVESDSDTDRDEAIMAAEMVGGRLSLEGEWSTTTQNETSGHQGGVLEPAVSAALDFKAMLEAALRGPSFPYDGGIVPNLENAHGHGQHSSVDDTSTSFSNEADSNSPRTRSEPGEIKDLPAKYGQTSVEDNMHYYQGQGLASKAPMEANTPKLLQPPPILMAPVFKRNDYAFTTVSMGPQSPSASSPGYTPTLLHSPLEGFRGDPESSDPTPQGRRSTAEVKNSTTGQPSLSTSFSSEENNPQPTPQYRPLGVSDDAPVPTLPEGLFQGLQAAIQAREARSKSIRSNDPKPVQSSEEGVGKDALPISAEKHIPSRWSVVRSSLENSKGGRSLGAEKVPKLGRAPTKPQGPLPFPGGLFDDDDIDEIPSEITEGQNDGSGIFGRTQSSPFMERLTSSRSMARQGLFDDLDDLSIGSASEASENSGLVVERADNASHQQSFLSFPDRKEVKRSSVPRKELFGDSDDDELF